MLQIMDVWRGQNGHFTKVNSNVTVVSDITNSWRGRVGPIIDPTWDTCTSMIGGDGTGSCKMMWNCQITEVIATRRRLLRWTKSTHRPHWGLIRRSKILFWGLTQTPFNFSGPTGPHFSFLFHALNSRVALWAHTDGDSPLSPKPQAWSSNTRQRKEI